MNLKDRKEEVIWEGFDGGKGIEKCLYNLKKEKKVKIKKFKRTCSTTTSYFCFLNLTQY